MKVIQNNYKENKLVDSRLGFRICPYCKSILEVENGDIYHHNWSPGLGSFDYEDVYDYINCPCCYKEIILDSSGYLKKQSDWEKEQEIFKKTYNID